MMQSYENSFHFTNFMLESYKMLCSHYNH